MQHVDLFGIDQLEKRRQRERIEPRSAQIGDVDALRFECFFRQVFAAQTDERDVEAFAIESMNHPAEETLDAMHPRPFPAEMITDLQDIQRAWAHPCGRR